jgi:HipA-like kinase
MPLALDRRPAVRKVTVTRYVTPLREGGSLPAIVEADDDGTYVCKFRGAGQGAKALIAELVAGEIGRAAGVPVPDIVLAELDPDLGRTERDPEIQGLIKASAGLNLALDYLPGAIEFDVLDRSALTPLLASSIVWFDAYVTNVDRTARNPNLLFWRKELWLIDHGASLYLHHNWGNYQAGDHKPFPQIRDHVLLPVASALPEADAALRNRLTPELIAAIVDLIPDVWLEPHPEFASPADNRAAYTRYLQDRLEATSLFLEEALNARAQLI